MRLHRMGQGWEGIKQFPFLLVCLSSQFRNCRAPLAADSFLWLMLLEKSANVEKHRDVLAGIWTVKTTKNVHVVSKGFNQEEYKKDERAFTINIRKKLIQVSPSCLLYSLVFSMQKATPASFLDKKYKSLQRIISQQHYKVSIKQNSVIENYCLYYCNNSCTQTICHQWSVSTFPIILWHGPVSEKR